MVDFSGFLVGFTAVEVVTSFWFSELEDIWTGFVSDKSEKTTNIHQYRPNLTTLFKDVQPKQPANQNEQQLRHNSLQNKIPKTSQLNAQAPADSTASKTTHTIKHLDIILHHFLAT